ncbi:MAG: transporter substrate-binding domain-containing protein [Clostridiaceae bacterium]|nr:transporter substrate-binding domain-containing protein [Clostridiaceae bacterium]
MKKRASKALIFVCIISILAAALFIVKKNDASGNSNSVTLTKAEREWLNANPKLVYAADKNAPPLRFLDKSDNQYKGVVVDYVNLLSVEIGFTVELHPLLWEDALASLAEGKSDMCDMFPSEERGKYYLFTKPFYNLRAVMAVRTNDNITTKSLKDKNFKIAVQKGDYTNEFLNKNYPDLKLVYVPDVYEALMLLDKGEVDAIVGDEPVVLYQLNENNLKDRIKIGGEPLYESGCVIAVPRSKPQLISILNKGIDALTRKEQVEKIQQKWFGISAPIAKQYDIGKLKSYLALLLAAALFIFLIMFILAKSLKNQVKLRTRELEDSRNDLQIVFDGMTEYMITVNKNNTIMNINKAFTEYVGKPRDKIIGASCSSHLNRFCSSCDNCIVANTFDTSENHQIEIYNKNEIYKMDTFPLMDSDMLIKNVLVIISNITSEKISKNQVLQANKMAAIGQLAAGIAHEIRNPLGIVRNHTFILKSENIRNEKMVETLETIDSAIERASKTITNLLNFSRISGDSWEWVDISHFIHDIIELQYKYMQSKNINYSINCDKELKVYINQESLKHILINLISNAIDAMDSNGNLTIEVSPNEHGLKILCSDTGCGIQKGNLEKLFNPFYTTKDPGKGTGLGLYIVYNEVKKLNGEIFVTSEVNKGTSFEVFIPVKMEVCCNE